jgi:N-acetyl-gamma-glutamyl-phosphate reductase
MDVAVVGANGYSGEELCRILLGHPSARLAAVTSRQHAGKPLADILPRLAGLPSADTVTFSASEAGDLVSSDIPFFFLALPHGLASAFAAPLVAAGRRVIDLSADFRLRDPATFEEFYGGSHGAPELLGEAVYGIPEMNREGIAGARLVASAGCYPTSILLPLVPLLEAGLIDPSSIVITSASGVTGAGRKAETGYLFGECNESLRAYGLPKHRHLSEIEQELSAASGAKVTVSFVPHLAPMNRGIHTTILVQPRGRAAAVRECLDAAYAAEPFVRLRTQPPDTKNVAATNFCDIAVFEDPRTGRVVLLSVLDNLVKGAAGQAVQNFNIMAGLPETAGLL